MARADRIARRKNGMEGIIAKLYCAKPRKKERILTISDIHPSLLSNILKRMNLSSVVRDMQRTPHTRRKI